ncbi:MAG TPA: GTPase ObgE, partial [Firmicutes bacterium]|nr:GTPase ObgE [Bacillota bacterium]
MFIDRARIYLKAGDGGDGVVRFRREKYVPAGGPAGGDGGRGGSIYFVVDEGMSTLMDFRYRRKFVAPSGEPGKSKNMAGKNGEGVGIPGAPGTPVEEEQKEGVLLGLTPPRAPGLGLPGGRGGAGRARPAAPPHPAPPFSVRGWGGRARRGRV